MFEYTIRKGNKKDLDAICCLQLYSQEKAFAEITSNELKVPTLKVYTELWTRRLDSKENDYSFYVAYRDHLLLGFIYARMVVYKGKKIALIKALYVNPTHWDLGIGYALLKRLYRDIEKQEIEVVSLFILDQNKRAETLYKKFGFKFDSVVRKIVVHDQEYFLRHMVDRRVINSKETK